MSLSPSLIWLYQESKPVTRGVQTWLNGVHAVEWKECVLLAVMWESFC